MLCLIFINNIVQKFPDIFPLDQFTFENFVWAFTVCETRRTVTPDDGPAVIPLPSLLAHHPYITVCNQNQSVVLCHLQCAGTKKIRFYQ